MLKDLRIENLVLMESCFIQWDPRLNAVTGETGSGKTAILHGLKLLLGHKADPSLIRKEASKGFAQACFEFPFPEELQNLLHEAGIPFDEFCLILSREISLDGKSKSWINERRVSLSFLQRVGAFCIQIVDQNLSTELQKADSQRELLDRFASLEKQTKQFALLLDESKGLAKEEKELLERELQKERELSFCYSQLEELSSIDLKEGDEEAIFQEYVDSTNAEEASSDIHQICDILIEGPSSLLSKTKEAKTLCTPYAERYKAFKEVSTLLKDASSGFKEAVYLLREALSLFDPDPSKKEMLDQKLQQIDILKKKYGPTLANWEQHKKLLQEKIDYFEQIEEDKETLLAKKNKIDLQLSSLAKTLSEKRNCFAQQLTKKLTQEIQTLNMPEASFEILVEKQERASHGDDSISFWLSANKGEGKALVKDCSSGGELARLLLAFKLCLAEKNHTPTLIFDEIDAGVGGETARLIGEKLKTLSSHRQIICITHFPQVACEAHCHLQVTKVSEGLRTQGKVKTLSAESRKEELLRMLGGKKNSFIL